MVEVRVCVEEDIRADQGLHRDEGHVGQEKQLERPEVGLPRPIHQARVSAPSFNERANGPQRRLEELNAREQAQQPRSVRSRARSDARRTERSRESTTVAQVGQVNGN